MRVILAAIFGFLVWCAFIAATLGAWITHVIACIQAGAWILLIIGCVIAPVGVIHGWMIWLGMGWAS